MLKKQHEFDTGLALNCAIHHIKHNSILKKNAHSLIVSTLTNAYNTAWLFDIKLTEKTSRQVKRKQRLLKLSCQSHFFFTQSSPVSFTKAKPSNLNRKLWIIKSLHKFQQHHNIILTENRVRVTLLLYDTRYFWHSFLASCKFTSRPRSQEFMDTDA